MPNIITQCDDNNNKKFLERLKNQVSGNAAIKLQKIICS